MIGVVPVSLQKRLEEDMKNAMREKESGKFRLSVIRMARSALKYAEIEARSSGRELTDEDVLAVLAKEVKMRRDSLLEFTKGGRADLADAAQQEIDILMGYMPAQLAPEEIRSLVEETIKAAGASAPKDMGKVMGLLQPKVKGRADGKLVSDLVKELLGQAK